MLKLLNRNYFICALIKPQFFSTQVSNQVAEQAQEKSIRVAVIGLPNSGKSTLINSIIQKRVSENK
jgi:ribosome biogenesis GTPase A